MNSARGESKGRKEGRIWKEARQERYERKEVRKEEGREIPLRGTSCSIAIVHLEERRKEERKVRKRRKS
jgi:hypothetical protein